MCEFCIQHGEGKKWYLQARNYSEDLLSDLRRRRFIADFFGHPEHLDRDSKQMEKLRQAPAFVQRAVRAHVVRRMKKWHFGQVLPLEDVEAIFGFVNSIVRVPCICRHVTLGREARYCYGVSLGPGGGVAMFFRRHRSPFSVMEVALNGILPEARYDVSLSPDYREAPRKRMNGKDLARLSVTIPEARGSLLLRYKRAK